MSGYQHMMRALSARRTQEQARDRAGGGAARGLLQAAASALPAA